MKNWKRITSCVLCMGLLLASANSVPGLAETYLSAHAAESGSCGEGLTWTLNSMKVLSTFTNSYNDFDGTIYGSEGSTAQEYAKQFDRKFEVIENTSAKPIPGDVNGDGIVDIMDCIAVNKYVIGVSNLTDEQRRTADLTGDGEVTASDSLAILKLALA